MATLGKTASEVLNGPIRQYTLNMGTFTAATAVTVWGGSVLEDDTTSGVNATRLGTYDAFIKPGYLVEYDTGGDRKVGRVDASDSGEQAIGVCESVEGVANGTWRGAIRELQDGDILEFECDAAIGVDDKVDFASDAYDDARPHGLRVVDATTTAGLGYALNSTSAGGEIVHVLIARHRVDGPAPA